MYSAQRYVGIALDVSASMRESLPNSSSDQLSRFQSILFALRTVIRGHQQLASEPTETVDAIQMCAYLFGTTASPRQVCDLFSLLTVVRSADHADQASVDPIDDPYHYLDSIARVAHRSAWVRWIRDELEPAQAHALASNLHRFGMAVAVAALERLLPDVSEEDLRVLRGVDRFGQKGIRNRVTGAAELRSESPFAFWSAHRSVARSGGSARMREQIERAERIARVLASRELTVEQVLAGSGEAEREVLHVMVEHLPTTTLTIPEIAELLDGHRADPADENLMMSRFSAVVGGDTPLCEVLRQLERRYQLRSNPTSSDPKGEPWTRGDQAGCLIALAAALAEAAARRDEPPPRAEEPTPKPAPDPPAGPVSPTSILVIVSDGHSTDGDPRPIVARMRNAGVLVVCCYVTCGDVVNPRTLVGQPEQHWDDGAKVLFDCASAVDEGPHERDYLRAHGWTIEPQARFFSQVNHSTYVSELLAAALG